MLRCLYSPGWEGHSCREAVYWLFSGFFQPLHMFLHGDHMHEAYSKWHLTKLLHRGYKVCIIQCYKCIIYFNVHVDSDSIDPAEMRTMLAACVAVGVLGPTDNVLDTITLSLFDDADKDKAGEISFDQFRDVLQAHSEILDNLAVR